MIYIFIYQFKHSHFTLMGPQIQWYICIMCIHITMSAIFYFFR